MINAEDIAIRRALIDSHADLRALRDHLAARAAPVMNRMPVIPDVKALLSRNGGTCPDDGAPLAFDPWSPDLHRCPYCGVSAQGERHHQHWARTQHLWVAERAAELATLHAVTGDAAMASRARELLAAYYERYFALPNRDNVLGPSHLFFSTYLESIWILNYLAAATLLRESGALAGSDVDAVSAIADEAATLIGEFDEGMSNRQTWHAAALTAIAVWFGDEDLASTAITGRTGLLGHLADGFGDDGMWHEGENYHLFAMRGMLIGLQWAVAAGADLLHDAELATHLGSALMAPATTALPDMTFPARKDSRYGVSLAHPAYLESWEAGAALLGERVPDTLDPWLRALYAAVPRTELVYDAYLHDAGEPQAATHDRTRLSWLALWMMRPSLPDGASVPHRPGHHANLLPQQGIAIVRDDDRYVALECIGGGEGHAHPDRLHLTVHADGVHWLPDPGTASYVTRDLFWYRSTLAHNAPRIDQRDQARGEAASCTAFDSSGAWTHVRAAWGAVERIVVTGPRWIVDVTRFSGDESHLFEIPWHLNGTIDPIPGDAGPVDLASEFVTGAQLLSGSDATQVVARHGEKEIALHLAGGDVVTVEGPGLPGTMQRAGFVVHRCEGTSGRLVAVIAPGATVERIEVLDDTVVIHEAGGTTSVAIGALETVINDPGGRIILTGNRPRPRLMPTVQGGVAAPRPVAAALRIGARPELDGTLDGFDLGEPISLDDELCYFRSEEPYPGAECFSAQAWINWDLDVLYLAVDVTAPHIIMREPDAAPLLLDNEPDDIHAAGIQVYYRRPGEPVTAIMIRPTSRGTAVRGIGNDAPGEVFAAWAPTADGYRITAALPCPGLGSELDRKIAVDFDMLVNEMTPDRARRSGQLGWSSGPGWVYLRGDRHGSGTLGVLELHT